MARANVSIEGVTQFKKSIEAQNQKVQETGNNAISKLSELQEQLNTEKVKAEKAAEELANALVKVQGKITEQEAVVEELEGRLSNLISSEPSPAEELVTEPDEYDDEGNIVSVGASYYEETSAHSSWRSEVSSLESEVSAENSKLQSYKDVESKVLNCQNDIHGQIDLIQGLQTKIESGQVEITQMLSELNEFSGETCGKISNVQNVIQEYLSKNISFSNCAVPAISINSSMGGILSGLNNKPSESYIFNPNHRNYNEFNYARQTIVEPEKYIHNNDTQIHEYESCHVDYIPSELRTEEIERSRERRDIRGNKSKFRDDISYDDLSQLIRVGLLNSTFIDVVGESGNNQRCIYQVNFNEVIGTTRCSTSTTTGEVGQRTPNNMEETSYMTIVVGEDPRTHERVISCYPGRSAQAISRNIF